MLAILRTILVGLSNWILRITHTLWTYRIIVISLLVIYVALWHADQGQDLLINLNDDPYGVALFYILISMMAALFWHLPKYLSKNSSANFDSLGLIMKDVVVGHVSYRKRKDSSIARMLGVLTFLVPAFAVLNVLDKYGIPVWKPDLLFLGSACAYAAIFQHNWIEKMYTRKPQWSKRFHVAILVCVLLPVLLGLLNERRPMDLIWLCIGLLLMSMAFAISVSIRRHITPARLTRWLIRQSAARWVMGAATGMAIVFLGFSFFPYAGTGLPFFTISALLCGLVFYVLFFGFLLLWERVTEINFITFFLATAMVMAVVSTNPFHEVRQIKMTTQPDLLTLHLRNWLDYRRQEILSRSDSTPYPIFIVNAYGGGIRAAAWTSLVVQELDQRINSVDTDKTFQHHVVAYSGASGGTIGASVLCALRSKNDPGVIKQPKMLQFYRRDFLSPVLIGVICSDFFFSTFGNILNWLDLKMNDRAVLQETTWERQFKEHFDSDIYGGEFTAPWGQSNRYEVPLLFANTTEIKTGLKGIIAPVVVDSTDFPGAVIGGELLDCENNFPYSTAAFCSARFPFISPAGKIGMNRYFMDGGLKENSGAETTRQLKAVIDRLLDQDPELKKFVKIFILSLPNTAPKAKENRRRNIFQLGAPLQALETNWEGNTMVADSLNRRLYADAYFSMRPTNEEISGFGKNFKAVLPLGWQMSSRALERMVQSIGDTHNKDVMERITDLVVGQ